MNGKEDVRYVYACVCVCVCVCAYKGTVTDIIKNETMPFAAPWMNLEIIIPSEESQRKTNTTMISFLCGI